MSSRGSRAWSTLASLLVCLSACQSSPGAPPGTGGAGGAGTGGAATGGVGGSTTASGGTGGTGGTPGCTAVADCKAEETECHKAVACDAGTCAFEDLADGKALSQQTPGDCAKRVCDGAGGVKLVAEPTDAPDDGKVCTVDSCAGMTPQHDVQAQLPCYTGPASTRGKGACTDGVQLCDAQGNLTGGCVGEVLPSAETCLSPLDEDCDGQVNEEGQGCSCAPGSKAPCYPGPTGTEGVGVCHGGQQTCNADGLGYGPCVGAVTPAAETCDAAKLDEDCDGQVNEEGASCVCGDGYVSTGEECDDGNASSTDGCTTLCKLPKCGDGFAQPALGEACDDGNTVSGDGCSSTCLKEGAVVAVASGDYHACALLDDGRVKCWGWNVRGQLGLGDKLDRGDAANEMGNNLPAVSLGTGKTAIAISAGVLHTCALLSGGSVKCWGKNEFGQLGIGDTSDRGDDPNEMGDNLPEVNLGTAKTAVAVRASENHTCALLTGGSVKCWGSPYGGGLGDLLKRGDDPNEMGDNLPAVNLGTGKTAVAIETGAGHTCALLNDGSIKCWGGNSFGELGLGDTNDRGTAPNQMGDNLPAVNLGTGKTATAISVGSLSSCALLSGGSVKCWGWNSVGELGLGDTNPRGDGPGEMGDNLPAVDLGAGKTVVAVSVGDGHACAVLNGGGIKCWGFGSAGALGLGLGDVNNRGDSPNEMGDSLPLVNLGTGLLPAAVSAGESTCVLFSNTRVKCWGYNGNGQLGLGDVISRGWLPAHMGDNLPFVRLFTSTW